MVKNECCATGPVDSRTKKSISRDTRKQIEICEKIQLAHSFLHIFFPKTC